MSAETSGGYPRVSTRPPYNDAVVIPPKVERSIRRDCVLAMQDHLGSGYVPDFYANEAGPFVAIALAAYRQGVRDERDKFACAHENVIGGGPEQTMECEGCGHVFSAVPE